MKYIAIFSARQMCVDVFAPINHLCQFLLWKSKILSHNITRYVAFPLLQILKKFSNIVTKSDKKIKMLYASMLRDHTNSNNSTKNLRNFVSNSIKGHLFTKLEVTPLWQCDNIDVAFSLPADTRKCWSQDRRIWYENVPQTCRLGGKIN